MTALSRILSFSFLLPLFIAGSIRAEAPAATAEPVATTQATPAAVFVVRHAEKTKERPDPRLTEAGRERAAELVSLLDGAGIDAVYSTQWRRTQETADPIADALGLEILTVQSDDGFEAQLAQRIQEQHPGEVVLVVGHSNTNPTLLEALGVPEPPAISDSDYDDVYLIVWPSHEGNAPSHSGNAPRLIRLGYGRPTP